VRAYVPGTVAGVIVCGVDPVLVVSAAEVAVMVTVVGRPAAMVGAVYTPVVEPMEPQGLGVPAHDCELLKVQVTAVLVVFVTFAVNVSC